MRRSFSRARSGFCVALRCAHRRRQLSLWTLSRGGFSSSGDTGIIPHDATHIAIVCGPSGVGKGTLISHLRARVRNVTLSVSHTTRPPRPGEVDGVDYTFVTREQFEQGVVHDEYVEHGEVHGNYYGTSKTHLEKLAHSGHDLFGDRSAVVLELDVAGAHKIQEYLLYDALSARAIHAKYLFVGGPRVAAVHQSAGHAQWLDDSLATLRQRLVDRGTETEQQIERRQQTARVELEFLAHHPHFFDKVLENDNLDAAKLEIYHIFSDWFPWLISTDAT